MYKKLLFFITWFLVLLSFFSISTHWFLWEDLWLNLYESIDEGFEELEIKQYQYELSGQWQAWWDRIKEYVNSILAQNSIECEIESISDINLIADATEEQLQAVFALCNTSADKTKMTTTELSNIIREIWRVRTSLETRAEEKSKQIYEIARIWLYSDGVTENSPFDIITDIEEIDRVIFSEELLYIWEDYGTLDFSDDLDDYIAGNDRIENAAYNREDEDREVNDSEESSNLEWSNNTTGETPDISKIIEAVDENGDPIIATEDGHLYACYKDKDGSGLSENNLNWLTNNIYTSGSDIETLTTRFARNPWSLWDRDNRTRGRLWVPIESRDLEAKARFGPEGQHARVYDNFDCDSFFCITVWFVTKSQNLLWWWGQTVSVKSVLEKVDEHLDHISSTSLVQAKMTTNNFENNLLIKDLSSMLRGFWLQIQTKAPPILNIDNSESEEKNGLLWWRYKSTNMLRAYYKNLGLDYDRANDLAIYSDEIAESEIIQRSWELPLLSVTDRMDVYNNYKNKLKEENEILSASIENHIIQEDLWDFYDQFIELERFALSIEDFAIGVDGVVEKMLEIPTQKP